MLIYADHNRVIRTRDALRKLTDDVWRLIESPGDHDGLVGALIDAGELETGLADALCPRRDRRTTSLQAVRAATEALGMALACSWRREPGVDTALHRAHAALRLRDLPAQFELRIPEGYAYYALYPEAYIDASVEWASGARPPRVIVLGLRSIGTSLSAAVHGALTLVGVPVTSWTVRPRGHPFDRRPSFSEDLTREWMTVSDAVFLIVDEGPGLSGSSLTGVAAELHALGVPESRIVLLAAWNPDPAGFRSSAARARWPRHKVLTGGFDRVRTRVLAVADVTASAADVSAGRWREHLLPGRQWPPAHPQHERMKFLDDEHLWRFAGLGGLGEEALGRLERLANAGWTPAPVKLSRGFLSVGRLTGPPMDSRLVDDRFLRRVAAYVGWLRRNEARSEVAALEPLAEMLRVNVREGIGDRWLDRVERLAASAGRFAEPQVCIDGRLQLHEWVQTSDQLSKTDVVDHHRDHFFPGSTDVAWDVAGAIVEIGLRDGDRQAFTDAYATASGDHGIPTRLPFYVSAYAAFRMAYCAMAVESVDAVEAARFSVARDGYARILRESLAVV